MALTQLMPTGKHSADLSHFSHSAFVNGASGIIEPLIKKQRANTDADISNIREQITANFKWLQELDIIKAGKKGGHVHIVTLGEGDNLRGVLFPGTSTPALIGKPASTTAAALKKLLSETETAVCIEDLQAAIEKIAPSGITSVAGPSKLRVEKIKGGVGEVAPSVAIPVAGPSKLPVESRQDAVNKAAPNIDPPAAGSFKVIAGNGNGKGKDVVGKVAQDVVTPVATPSKLIVNGKEVSPFDIVENNPASAINTTLKQDSVLGNVAIKKYQPVYGKPNPPSPFAFPAPFAHINMPNNVHAVANDLSAAAATPPQGAHARMTSTDMIMWGSEIVNNPKFGPNGGKGKQVMAEVVAPKVNKPKDTILNLSFGSDNYVIDDSSMGNTVANTFTNDDPFVEVHYGAVQTVVFK